jgi:hypothetical protein
MFYKHFATKERKMSLPLISKSRKLLSVMCSWWIPVKKYRKALRGILLIGVKRYIQTIKTDKNKKFDNDLAVVAIMKNEGAYLKEWLDFHIMVGVQKFYLYDNESNDNTKDVLKPYIKKGIVDYTYYPGLAKQMPAYKDAVNRHSDESRWMAFIDLDEFIFSLKYDNLVEYLKTLPTFGALVVGWMIYGSSNQKEKKPGFVIERFKMHADKTWGVKSIFNPRMILDMTNPHTSEVAGFTIDENGKRLGFIDQTNNPPSCDIIRINHYVTKSYEEFMIRCNKGDACYENMAESPKAKALNRFNIHNRNEVYDDVMDKYVKKLKKL